MVLAACATPVELDDFCREAERAECEAAQKHCGLSGAIDCSTREPRFDCLASERVSLRSGDKEYDAAAARQCIDALRNAQSCAMNPRLEIDSCLAVVHGVSDEGQACGTCRAGLRCKFPESGGCGTCVRGLAGVPQPLGASCVADAFSGPVVCRTGLECRHLNELEAICVPLPARGEACSTPCRLAGSCCAPGLVCRDDRCEPAPQPSRAKVGESCKQDECETRLSCVDGACLVPRALGERCSSSVQCDQAPCIFGTCSLNGAMAGASCGVPRPQCDVGLACIADSTGRSGTCGVPPVDGEACLVTCASGLVCRDGVCGVQPRSTCR